MISKKLLIFIGVVGQIASGKGVLVKYLTEELGFASYSLSSILHEALDKKGIQEFTRSTLQDMGDKLRRENGDDILAKRMVDRLKGQKMDHVVIEGIRNPGEVEYFKKKFNFVLIGVKANRELRFKRLLSRNKEWDPKDWNNFVKVDRRDLGVDQHKTGQQVGRCLVYCDYILTNNKDIKDFQKKVNKLMKRIFNQVENHI